MILDDLSLDFEENLMEVENSTPLNIDTVKEKIPIFPSEKLCDMIVCARYFNFVDDRVAILCMEELSKRRMSGDSFNFEKYIDETFNGLPELNFEIPDFRTIMSGFKIK